MKMGALNLICIYPRTIPLPLQSACMCLLFSFNSFFLYSFLFSNNLEFVRLGMVKLVLIQTCMPMERFLLLLLSSPPLIIQVFFFFFFFQVCLSLLGTWSGPGWDKKHSTILQVNTNITRKSLIFNIHFFIS